MVELKTINDTVHGTIRLDAVTLELLETLELQRLNSIRQLGLTYLVFPGANHSRIEHSLGVGHVAGEMADALGAPPQERLRSALPPCCQLPMRQTYRASLFRRQSNMSIAVGPLASEEEARVVQQALRRVPGVTKVVLSEATSIADVQYDPSLAQPPQILEAVQRLGRRGGRAPDGWDRCR